MSTLPRPLRPQHRSTSFTNPFPGPLPIIHTLTLQLRHPPLPIPLPYRIVRIPQRPQRLPPQLHIATLPRTLRQPLQRKRTPHPLPALLKIHKLLRERPLLALPPIRVLHHPAQIRPRALILRRIPHLALRVLDLPVHEVLVDHEAIAPVVLDAAAPEEQVEAVGPGGVVADVGGYEGGGGGEFGFGVPESEVPD
jgi:hypothetical protein